MPQAHLTFQIFIICIEINDLYKIQKTTHKFIMTLLTANCVIKPAIIAVQ